MNFKISVRLNKNSFIWKFDPRLKIISSILFFILIFLPATGGKQSLTVYLILLFFLLFVFIVGKLSWKTFKVILKSSFLMLFFLFLFNSISFNAKNIEVNNPNIILNFKNFFVITKDGLTKTLYFTLRITLVIMTSIILVSTTTTMQMTTAIESLLSPLKYIKFPVHIFSMIITLSLRLIPTIMEESENVITAQASRGLDFRKGSWKIKLKSLISLLIPLIISSIRKADEMAIAMEARGYNPDKERTRYFENQFKKIDWILFLLVFSLFIGLIFCLQNEGLINLIENKFLLEKWLNQNNH